MKVRRFFSPKFDTPYFFSVNIFKRKKFGEKRREGCYSLLSAISAANIIGSHVSFTGGA